MTPTANIDKEKIITYAKGLFEKNGRQIMFMYFGDSVAYGIYEEGYSDIDVNVMINGYLGYGHVEIGGIDFFSYGDDRYLARQNLQNDLPLYYKVFIDDALSLDETLMYLNPIFEKNIMIFYPLS